MLPRKAFEQRLAVCLLGMLDAELESGQMNDVVWIGARRETQGAIGQPGQQAAELPFRSALRPDATEIMHTWRERPVLPLEGLRQPARDTVLFQNEHAATRLASAAAAARPPMPDPITIASHMACLLCNLHADCLN
jgi:hypothetical protein